jgi:predicted porin
MKKSLLALAVLGAFAGAASAQTNVTIYGIVDAAVMHQKDDRTVVNGGTAGEALWAMTDGNDSFNKNGSRLGFKGTEDLGGGLSAIFVLENGFSVDTGLSRADGLFSRQAFVGLQGGFGAVKFGRQYTPMHIALDTIDPFNTGFTGNVERLFAATVRTSNTINYSYSAAGFSGQVGYSLGEIAGENSDGRQIGLGLGYANGPLNVQFAYHNANASPLATTPVLNETKVAMLGATYDLGVAKLHAAFGTNKSEVDATGVEAQKERNYMLGVSAPVGAGNVMASFIRRDDRLAAEAREADQYALGYVHNLSKRTNVYTSYAHSNDRSAANLDGNAFNVGVQHKF